MRGKRLLVFDFDGTLADTSPLHEEAFNAVLSPWGLRIDYPSIAGLRTRDALVACFGTSRVNISELLFDELSLLKQIRVRNLIQQDLKSLPGVNRFLHWAKHRFKLALCSSGSRGTVSLAIEKLGYMDWFAPMLCAEDMIYAKPSPEGFLKVLELANIKAADALAFEDSMAGLESAQRAGIDVVDVRSLRFDYICDKLAINEDYDL